MIYVLDYTLLHISGYLWLPLEIFAEVSRFQNHIHIIKSFL